MRLDGQAVGNLALAEDLQHAAGVAGQAVGQDRLEEKTLFQRLGIGVADFRPADTPAALRAAVAEVGAPCIVKTRRLGYDGRGQVRLQPGDGLAAAVDAADLQPEVSAAELQAALRALDGIGGEHSAEHLLDRIYGRFCLGK